MRELLKMKRGVCGCCPGHDPYPSERYTNARSRKARKKGKIREHKYVRTLVKLEIQRELDGARGDGCTVGSRLKRAQKKPRRRKNLKISNMYYTSSADTKYKGREIRAEWKTNGSLLWVQGLADPIFRENMAPEAALDIGRDIIEDQDAEEVTRRPWRTPCESLPK